MSLCNSRSSTGPVPIDALNLKYLQTLWPQKSSSKIRQCYIKSLRPRLLYRGGMLLLSKSVLPDAQVGGMSEYISMAIDGKDYVFRISVSEGELVSTRVRKGGDRPVEVYFLSLARRDESKSTACIWLTVIGKTGMINGLDRQYRCIGEPTDAGSFRISQASKQGEILVKALIKYARGELKLNRLEVDDNSHYPCGDHLSIRLISSLQLLGKQPYYTRFGFTPVHESTRAILSANQTKMSKSRVDGSVLIPMMSEIALPFYPELPRDIIVLIEQENGHPLSQLLAKIMSADCEFYAHIYEQLYVLLGLTPVKQTEFSLEL